VGLAEYNALLEIQGGVCAICGSDDPKTGGRSFAVDHDHVTGKVRGLLCSPCNRALGGFNDDPVRLQRAVDYLKEEQ